MNGQEGNDSRSSDDLDHEPALDRNPSPPPELQQNSEAVSGDSIGQTAFSKHWVLTTLMRLMDEVKEDVKKLENDADNEQEKVVDVDEDFQNELCQLWDMSMNSEVAKYLEEFKAVDILSDVIGKSRAPRVTEICVGILGNLACDVDICSSMVKNIRLIEMMLVLLKGPDPPTMIETTRFLYTCCCNKVDVSRWTEVIKSNSEVAVDVQFILQSSTNGDLLKTTTEFVGVLLDSDDELCENWADEALVISLLEAIKQVGFNHSSALEPYLHIFQLLSTNETGVEALMKCTDDLLEFLLKYLLGVCEDEIVGIDEHGNCLASAVSIISILFPSSSFNARNTTELMRCLLKILDPLYPLLRSTTSDTKKTDDSAKNGNEMSDQKDRNENNVEAHKDKSQEIEILFNVLQKFLCDIFQDFQTQRVNEQDNEGKKEDDEMASEPYYVTTLQYLDCACSRERINNMLFTVRDSGMDIVAILHQISETQTLERLQRIVKDFADGNSYQRSESNPESNS